MSWVCYSCGKKNKDVEKKCSNCFKDKININDGENTYDSNSIAVDEEKVSELNNYCRNCGIKFLNKVQECPNCKTKVIDKRVRCDDKYKSQLLIWLCLLILGFIFKSPLKQICFLISYITISGIHRDYTKVRVVSFLYGLETVLIIAYVLLILFALMSCMFACNGWW